MTTKIEWTDEVWNPVTGCTKVSDGCKNCYAERMARHLAGRYGYPEAPHHFDVTLRPERLEQSLRWKKSRRIFVCSMGDLFHDDVPFDFVLDVWRIMWQAKQHCFQILTKRPGRMLDFLEHLAVDTRDGKPQLFRTAKVTDWLRFGSLSNVWLGVTAENQTAADERIPQLLQCPAAVRFVSCEPLLGPIDLTEYMGANSYDWWSERGPIYPGEPALSWCIVGGESGPGARPMHPDWARGLRDQCQVAGVPYFYKQHGAWLHESQFLEPVTIRTPGIVTFEEWNLPKYQWPDDSYSYRVGKKAAGRLLDGRTWDEFPE